MSTAMSIMPVNRVQIKFVNVHINCFGIRNNRNVNGRTKCTALVARWWPCRWNPPCFVRRSPMESTSIHFVRSLVLSLDEWCSRSALLIDCNVYHQCMADIDVKLRCPERLIFNETLKRCDWPESSVCKSGSILVEDDEKIGFCSDKVNRTTQRIESKDRVRCFFVS